MGAVRPPAGIDPNVLQLLLLQPEAVGVGGQEERVRHERLVGQQVVASNLEIDSK